MMTEDLLRSIHQQTLTNRYRFNAPADKVCDSLMWHYKERVVKTGRMPIDNQQVQEIAKRIADFLTSDTDYHFGIMLCGLPGNGKTTMMEALYDMCKYRGDYSLLTSSKKFIKACEDGIDITAYFDEKRMFIDDLGAERKEVLSYGNVITPIVDLLEHRYAKRMFTVVTTNLDADQLGEKYGTRLRDRFREMFVMIPFRGGSFR